MRITVGSMKSWCFENYNSSSSSITCNNEVFTKGLRWFVYNFVFFRKVVSYIRVPKTVVVGHILDEREWFLPPRLVCGKCPSMSVKLGCGKCPSMGVRRANKYKKRCSRGHSTREALPEGLQNWHTETCVKKIGPKNRHKIVCWSHNIKEKVLKRSLSTREALPAELQNWHTQTPAKKLRPEKLTQKLCASRIIESPHTKCV